MTQPPFSQTAFSPSLTKRLPAWQANLALPKGRVGVIYGGSSAERDISLMSGQQVLKHLQAAGVDAVGIDLEGPESKAHNMTIVQQLQQPMDVAFIVLHGPGGEDGCVQAVLETLGVPYVGSGVMASSVAMHKLMTKMVWQTLGINTPPWEVLHDASDFEAVAKRLGLPLVVKPIHEGSSLGVYIVDTVDAMKTAFQEAQQFDRHVMAETYIQGEEYTVAIIEGQALPAIKLATSHQFYDKQAKYFADDTQYEFTNNLSAAAQWQLEATCEQAFVTLECLDWGRVDVMRDEQGVNWLLEINTLPGMTDHSLVPMAAQQVGLSFAQLVVLLLNLCMRRHANQLT